MFRIRIPAFDFVVAISTKDESKAIMHTRNFLRDHNFSSAILEKHCDYTHSFRMVCKVTVVPSPDNKIDPEQISIGW